MLKHFYLLFQIITIEQQNIAFKAVEMINPNQWQFSCHQIWSKVTYFYSAELIRKIKQHVTWKIQNQYVSCVTPSGSGI